MTPDQLKLLYGESFRQEARNRLKTINTLIVSRGSERVLKDTLTSLKIQAFPPDEEEDDLTREEREQARDQIKQLLGE
jgi:predicted nucleotidyltransferase